MKASPAEDDSFALFHYMSKWISDNVTLTGLYIDHYFVILALKLVAMFHTIQSLLRAVSVLSH